ncbi:MAG: MutS-related protein [Bryobacteraceae bacterium]
MPLEQYNRRLAHWREVHARAEARYRQLGNLRLLAVLAAVAIAALSFGAGLISPWWLLAPLAIFIAFAVVHDRVDEARATGARGVAYYERAIARLGNDWIGRGNQGERFRDPKHVYADDLDLFGRGSLFELLSTARTQAGEAALAKWLLAPGERAEILARQQAVAELCPRVDLREELALVGEDIRAAADAKSLATWGEQPPLPFIRGARIVAPALALAVLITLALWFAQVSSLAPLFAVLLVEVVFFYTIRDSVLRVMASISTPARELRLLSLLIEKLERQSFHSPRLIELQRAFETQGRGAPKQIRKLKRLIEQLDAARYHQLFRPLVAPLLWIPQYAMAIEAWRCAVGSRIGHWIAAIGEFEALLSLAGFAFDRPNAIFPELIETGPLIDAAQINHPLIAPGVSVGNDVSIGNEVRLLIVSGSNMSGKSTFLRAIGLNVVLAWAGAPVTCATFRVSPLAIGASMRANDSLADNRSRFYAEIERLRDVVELARSGRPALFLLDELLSGTNSHDRRIGAGALVRGLVERGAIGLVTTHDLALAQIAESMDGRAVNVHFEDQLENGEIHFDYRLRPGVVTRSNALELMRAVGLEV